MIRAPHLIIGLSVLILVSALGLALQKQQSRHLWHEIETLLIEKEELAIEWNQLRLEKSMLATSALLDQNLREALDMVVPDPTTVVYIKDEATQQYVKVTK